MVSLTPTRTLVALLLLLPAGTTRAEGPWSTNVAEAQATARELDVPLLLHFYADWCGPCRGMERNVLNRPELVARLGKTVVGVKVNSDNHRDLVARYNVRALPSDVLLSPTGQILARSEGAKQKLAYATWVDRGGLQYERVKAVKIASDPKPKQEEAVTPGDDAAPQITPRTNVAAADPTAKPMLAGYSPVTLAESRQWIAGSPEFAVVHKGQTFLLTSAEEVAMFEAEPAKYAPRLLGCDPVVLHEKDRAIEGSTEFGAFFDNQLFLFESAESRTKFRKTPYRYTKTRHVLRANEVVRRS